MRRAGSVVSPAATAGASAGGTASNAPGFNRGSVPLYPMPVRLKYESQPTAGHV